MVKKIPDKFNIPMNRCVMSVAPSLNAFVKKAQNNKKPVFCKKC